MTIADPAGVQTSTFRVVISADGTGYAYSYYRALSDLYVADGLS